MQLQAVHGGDAGDQSTSVDKGLAAFPAQSAASSPIEIGRRTYLNLTGIAKKFEVSERTAARLVLQPWFPKPMQLVSGTSRGVRRWVEQEIDEAAAASAPREEGKPEPAQLRRARDQRRDRSVADEVSGGAA